MRQPAYWTDSDKTLLPSISAAPSGSFGDEQASSPRRVVLRRGNSYTESESVWKRPRYQVFFLFLWLASSAGLWLLCSNGSPATHRTADSDPLRGTTDFLPIGELQRRLAPKAKSSLNSRRPKLNREILLDLVEDETERPPVRGPDIVNVRWPPVVTAVPEVRPSEKALRSGLTTSSVDAQFCQGQSRCRFLLPLWIGEQESRGRMHLTQVLHLAAALNRTLVLPNVGKSRIGACGKWLFDAYYDLGSFAKQAREVFGVPRGTIMLDDFKTWVDMRPKAPAGQLVFFDESSTALPDGLDGTLVTAEDGLEVYVDHHPLAHDDTRLKNARCLKWKFNKMRTDTHHPVSLRLPTLGHPAAVNPGETLVRILQREDIAQMSIGNLQNFGMIPQDVLDFGKESHLETMATEDAEVLLVHWDLRHFPFSTLSTTPSGPDYSQNIRALANKLTKPHQPYVAIHWRMETVPPALLPDCAEALVDSLSILLADPTLAEGIRSVWLATDLALSSSSKLQKDSVQRSNTFKTVTSEHTEAIEIVKMAFGNGGPLEAWELTGLAQEIERMKRDAEAYGEEFVLEDEDDSGLLWEDSGIWGILDKIVAMQSALFVSGARGCGRVRYVQVQ